LAHVIEYSALQAEQAKSKKLLDALEELADKYHNLDYGDFYLEAARQAIKEYRGEL